MNQFKPQTLCEEYLASMQCECRTPSYPSFLGLIPKWTKREKIDKAKEIALQLGYEVIDDSCSLLILPKGLPAVAKEQGKVVLLSSHADLARGISKPFVESFETATRIRGLRGTFDNSITNAVLLSLLHSELPQNTAYVLTGDEETGGCYGAHQAIRNLERFLEKHEANDITISAFAMDVTWEGSKDSFLTFENIGREDKDLGEVISKMIKVGIPLTCVASDGFPRNIPRQYRSKNAAMFDEGAAYRQMDDISIACSICIPTYGPMHSNRGMTIEAEKLEHYKLAVEKFIRLFHKNIVHEQELVSTPPTITR